jgi:hypothetical protein
VSVFATHWPDLEELSISFDDLWKISHVHGRPGLGYSCPKVIDLALGDSCVDSYPCYRPLAEFLDDFFPSIDGVIKRRETKLERYIGPWIFILDILAELVRKRKQGAEAKLDSDSQPEVLYECVDISVALILTGQTLTSCRTLRQDACWAPPRKL